MAGSRLARGSLGELLASRRRRFVGRDGELELVRAALDADEPPFSVLWVAGPGGIGKSTLLDVIAEEVDEFDLTAVRLEPRSALTMPGSSRLTARYPARPPSESR